MAKWCMVDPKPGDHLRVKTGDVYHHAIYIGNGEVVQFGLPFNYLTDASSVKVIKCPIEDFLHGGFLEVCVYSKKEARGHFKPEVIIQRALEHLGEGNYSFIHNNCEHFANFCIMGKKISTQVDNLRKDIHQLIDANNK